MTSGFSKLSNAIACIEPLQKRVLLSVSYAVNDDISPPENVPAPWKELVITVTSTSGTKVEVTDKDDRPSGIEIKINGTVDKTVDSLVSKNDLTRIVIIGGPGNDDLKVGDNINNPNEKYAQPRWVNVEIYGMGGDDKIRGGSGDDILVGGAGSDVVSGKGGNDLVIGGSGPDFLYGDKKDDIMIAGFTSYDGDPGTGYPLDRAALVSILREWAGYNNKNTSADIRMYNIVSGQNPYPDNSSSGPIAIAQLTTSATKMLSGGVSTVWDDGAYDELTGGSGADWFMFSALQDKVKDYKTTKDLALEGDLDTFTP